MFKTRVDFNSQSDVLETESSKKNAGLFKGMRESEQDHEWKVAKLIAIVWKNFVFSKVGNGKIVCRNHQI
ncbi:unnamed protein product [Caenorhabditis brenneri]